MSSPTRRSKSAEPLVRKRLKEAIVDLSKDIQSNLSGASSTDTIFHDCDEQEGLIPVLKNIQYCLHRSLTNSNSEQLKEADRILKKDCNKSLEKAVKIERTRLSSQIIKLINGTIDTNEKDIPKLKPYDDALLPCDDHDFEKCFKTIRTSYPKFSGKDKELLFFLREISELRDSYNITDRQVVRLISSKFSDRLLSYFLSEYHRDNNLESIFNEISHDYTDPILSSEEVERYIAYKFKFKNLANELTDLKQMVSLAHPNKPKAEITQIYLHKVISILPLVERQALISDLEQREELIRQGLVDSHYSNYELDRRIIFHCRNLNPLNSRPREVYRVSENDSSEKESENTRMTSCLEHIIQEMKKFSDFMDSFPNNNTSSNKVIKDKSIIVSANDNQYRRFVEQIKRDQFFKYIGQKIASDIKETEPQFREVLRLIRSDKPQGNPYNWDEDGNYVIDPSYIMDFPMFRIVNGRTPQFTKEALKAFSERCYCCGMPECAGKNSPDCIYHGKPDSWFPCQSCRSGFHNREDCKAVFVDE